MNKVKCLQSINVKKFSLRVIVLYANRSYLSLQYYHMIYTKYDVPEIFHSAYKYKNVFSYFNKINKIWVRSERNLFLQKIIYTHTDILYEKRTEFVLFSYKISACTYKKVFKLGSAILTLHVTRVYCKKCRLTYAAAYPTLMLETLRGPYAVTTSLPCD